MPQDLYGVYKFPSLYGTPAYYGTFEEACKAAIKLDKSYIWAEVRIINSETGSHWLIKNKKVHLITAEEINRAKKMLSVAYKKEILEAKKVFQNNKSPYTLEEIICMHEKSALNGY
jgi:hypothetical protein